jgi:hypothetical protein
MEVITGSTDTLTGLMEIFKKLDARGKKRIFRGQSDYHDSLTPGIYRNILEHLDPPFNLEADAYWLGRMERDTYRGFDDQSLGLFSSKVKIDDKWDTLILAQHYGLPTRLLDWTADFFVAIYFAVTEADGKDGHIWCVNVTDFPHPKDLGRLPQEGAFRLNVIKSSIAMQDLSFFVTQSKVHIDRDKNPSPIPSNQSGDPQRSGFLTFILPPYLDGRIRNQKGLFSIYLSNSDSDLVLDHAEYVRQLEHFHSLELLTKIIIPASCKHSIRKDLLSMGKDPFSIYPDLPGLISKLKDERLAAVEQYINKRK